MTNDERLITIRGIVEQWEDYGGVMTSEAALKAITGVLAPTPEERERGTSIVMFCDCPQKDFGLHKFDCQSVKELLWLPKMKK